MFKVTLKNIQVEWVVHVYVTPQFILIFHKFGPFKKCASVYGCRIFVIFSINVNTSLNLSVFKKRLMFLLTQNG